MLRVVTPRCSASSPPSPSASALATGSSSILSCLSRVTSPSDAASHVRAGVPRVNHLLAARARDRQFSAGAERIVVAARSAGGRIGQACAAGQHRQYARNARRRIDEDPRRVRCGRVEHLRRPAHPHGRRAPRGSPSTAEAVHRAIRSPTTRRRRRRPARPAPRRPPRRRPRAAPTPPASPSSCCPTPTSRRPSATKPSTSPWKLQAASSLRGNHNAATEGHIHG